MDTTLIENLLQQQGYSPKEVAFKILKESGFGNGGSGLGAVVSKALVETWSPFTGLFKGVDRFQGASVRDVVASFLEKYVDEYQTTRSDAAGSTEVKADTKGSG